MTLKELLEHGKDVVYDVMYDYILKKPEYRLAYSFEEYISEDLTECPVCGEVNERDEMVYHKWDVGEIEELICESCRNDE